MIYVVLILLLLWGTGASFAVGNLIHALLVLAVILFLVDYFTGRRPPVV